MISEDAQIPVALIGFGGSGSGIHAPLIAGTRGVETAVIVSRAEERRGEAQKRYPSAEVTSSIGAARHCKLAVVALPVAYRADIVEQLLDWGLRVVVEKPFAGDLDQARTLIDRAPGCLSVFHNRRWDSDYLTLRRLRNEGAWSGPVRLTSRIQRWQPAVRDTWRNRAAGGGYLREVGPHQIDQAVLLLGPVTNVYAEVSARRDGAVAEDDVFLALHHVDGSVSHLVSGALGDPGSPRFELSSSQAQISIASDDPQQDQLRAGMVPSDDRWGLPDAAGWRISRESGEQPLRPERGWWPGFYEEAAAWVRGAEPPVSPMDGLRTMAVIDAARRSAAERQVVSAREV